MRVKHNHQDRLNQERPMKSKLFSILLIGLLSGCSMLGKITPTALPTVVLDSGGVTLQVTQTSTNSRVTASGVVVPSQEAQISFALGGKVEEIDVVLGDVVQAGQTLLRLEGKEDLKAAISTAQFELEQGQQALKDLINQAEKLKVQTMQDIVTYAQAVRNAQYAQDNFTIPANQMSMDAVTALEQMKKRLDEARVAFEPYKNKPTDDETRKGLKEKLDQAQSDYNSAVRRLQLEYDLQVAVAKMTKAQQDYEVYSAGADPDQVRLAEARVGNAQTQLAATQAALGHLSLAAPFAGTVCKIDIHSGEWVLPGQAILVLADLTHLHIETTDLSERDVPAIKIGQSVIVFIKALNQEASGKVSAISPLADTLGGDVVYKTTIDLDTILPDLRAGMSVEVRFGLGE
jgi:HlyD family secretion protein